MKVGINFWENEFIKMELKDNKWLMTVKSFGHCSPGDHKDIILGSLKLFKQVKEEVESIELT